MFGILLIHAAYAVLMYSFSFRIMVIPHAVFVALAGIYMIVEKGLSLRLFYVLCTHFLLSYWLLVMKPLGMMVQAMK